MLLTVQRLPEFYQIQLFDSDIHWLCSFNRLSLTKHLCQCQNNWNMFLKHCCLIYFWLSLKSLWHPWPCLVIRSAPTHIPYFELSNVLPIKILYQAPSWQSDDYDFIRFVFCETLLRRHPISSHWVTRLEICRDRNDRWSCKKCSSCVNFSRIFSSA